MMVRLMIVALWVLGTLAQSSSEDDATRTTASPPTRTSSAASSAAVTHTIAVGATGHRFTENEIFADVGDTVGKSKSNNIRVTCPDHLPEFLFYPANHSVIRAPYLHPCIPYEMSGIGRVGFNSGFKPVKAITTDAPRWSIKINDTEPIFYYCGADGSCYKNQMIGVINPNSTQTLEKHMKSAEGLTFQVLPGEPYPEEQGDGPDSQPNPTSGEEGGQATNSPPSEGGSGSGLNAGQIAGIVIGAAAVLIIAAALIYLCGRRGGIDGAHRRIAFPGHHHPPPGMSEENYTVGTKSPAADSRWSAARWSTRVPLSPYREQASPPGIMPMMSSPVHAVGHPHPVYGFTGMEPQHSGHYQHASYMYDHGLKQANSPPPKPVSSPTPQTPIELPSESGLSPAQARYSWVGHDSEANFRTSK